jgi:hypothetical protein
MPKGMFGRGGSEVAIEVNPRRQAIRGDPDMPAAE